MQVKETLQNKCNIHGHLKFYFEITFNSTKLLCGETIECMSVVPFLSLRIAFIKTDVDNIKYNVYCSHSYYSYSKRDYFFFADTLITSNYFRIPSKKIN